MDNLINHLTRLCNSCGIEKPLSAFLEMSGSQGAHYGKICSQCRGTGKTSAIANKAEDSGTTVPTGVGIRGKEKLYIDLHQQQKIHTLKELYKKEKSDLDITKEKKIQSKNIDKENEKKHRDIYIEKKKQEQRQPSQNENENKNKNKNKNENQKLTEADALESANKEEETKKVSTDFNKLVHTFAPGRIEWEGQGMKSFLNWISGDAPIVKALKKAEASAASKEPKKEFFRGHK